MNITQTFKSDSSFPFDGIVFNTELGFMRCFRHSKSGNPNGILISKSEPDFLVGLTENKINYLRQKFDCSGQSIIGFLDEQNENIYKIFTFQCFYEDSHYNYPDWKFDLVSELGYSGEPIEYNCLHTFVCSSKKTCLHIEKH